MWLNDIEDNTKWSDEEIGPIRELVRKMKELQTELNSACSLDSNDSQV
jgi:hypothetical protein